MTFCCEKLQFETFLPSTTGPNIRVVKMLPIKGMKSDQGLCIVYITTGYTKFSLLTPKTPIQFCPFCGKEFKDVFKGNDFFNEEEGVSF